MRPPPRPRRSSTRLGRGDRERALPLLRSRRADDQRRRVRRAAAAAGGDRGREPGAAYPGLADAEGRRGLRDRVHLRPAPERMLSLDNAFTAEELETWADRIEKDVGSLPGLPVRAEGRRPGDQPALRERQADPGPTRGDGRTGEDITPNVRTIQTSRDPDRRRGPARAGRGARRGLLRGRRRSTSGTSPGRDRAVPSPTRATPRPARCARRTRASPRSVRCRWWCTASASGPPAAEPLTNTAHRSPSRTPTRRCGPGACRPRTGSRSSGP